MDSNEIRTVLIVLKEELRRKKLSYLDVANYLKVSEATIKRLFWKGEVSLQRLSEITSLVDLSLTELFAMSKRRSAKSLKFSREAEAFFAENPHYLSFLFHLRSGKSVHWIKKKFSLDQKSVGKYLRKLESLGLIQVNGPQIKALYTHRSISWDDHGPLGTYYGRKMIGEFSQHVCDSYNLSPNLYTNLSGFSMSRQLRDKFQREVDSVIKKFIELSECDPGDEREFFNTVVLSDAWEDSVFSQVKKV